MNKRESPKSPRSQVDKFKEAACEFETDDDEGRFNERIGRLAKTPSQKTI
jgi:hypothetical protein